MISPPTTQGPVYLSQDPTAGTPTSGAPTAGTAPLTGGSSSGTPTFTVTDPYGVTNGLPGPGSGSYNPQTGVFTAAPAPVVTGVTSSGQGGGTTTYQQPSSPTGTGASGAITNQQQALQAALSQGLTGQAAVDWVQQNYPQFNTTGNGIEWQPSTGTYGLGQMGGYYAQGPNGQWGFNATSGGGNLGSLGSGSLINTLPSAADAANMPGIQFAEQQAQRAIQSSAAAQGDLLTGGTLKNLAQYTAGTALNQGYLPLANLQLGYNQANYGNLYNLANLGLTGSSVGSA